MKNYEIRFSFDIEVSMFSRQDGSPSLYPVELQALIFSILYLKNFYPMFYLIFFNLVYHNYMEKEKKTLYGIPVNESLMWDFDWSEEEYKTEKFFKWYLARVLSNGTAEDLKNIDFKVIKKYLNNLIRVPRFIRNFWEWYLEM